MTDAKLKKFLYSLECQKSDPKLLKLDGPYCFRRLKEHLGDVQDLLEKVRGSNLTKEVEIGLEKEEVIVKEAIDFYLFNLYGVAKH